jgi:predicted metal-dependent hydrolase
MSLSFEYILKRKRGMKSLRIRIEKNGSVLVTGPYLLSKKRIEGFLQEKSDWILERRVQVKAREQKQTLFGSYETHAKRAKKLLKDRVTEINKHYQFSFERISIKQHETRWGSCSSKKNLNFNYRLYFLPLQLVDYVVAHELSHLKHMNHSKDFWDCVAQTIPDYKQRRSELKQYT